MAQNIILPKDPPDQPSAGFPASVLGVWEFNETTSDEVAQNDFNSVGGPAKYKQFRKFDLLKNKEITRSGVLFEEGVLYSVSANYNYNSDFTIAFWWFSPNIVGFTRHINTRNLEPRVSPLVSKGNSSHTDIETLLSQFTFSINEIGYSDTQNKIRVYLSTNGSSISHIVESDPFKPGLVHILVTYIKSQGRVRIDINGKTGILHSAPTSGLQQLGDLKINSIVPGFIAHKYTQAGGYLFDLVFTTYAATGNESLKMMRYGYEHITFSNLFDTRFVYFGLSFDQPTTISTTHLFTDGGSIFASKSNGEISKGDRPIWDKEFTYDNAFRVNLLNKSSTDETRRVDWTEDGIFVRGATIKI